MELSERLKTIASEVRFRTLADIGTDHGYIPIYLAERGLIDKAAACDIKKGPLARAKENIKKHRLDGMIDLRLGGGLSPVKPGEFETAVIAGMGGMLLTEIIKASADCAKSFRQLVLQPQLDIPEVRKFLHTASFKINNEEMVPDENKYYNILSCSPGSDEIYDENDYLFGKILLRKKDPVLKNDILRKLKKTEKIIADMSTQKHINEAASQRLSELKAAAENYERVLAVL
jgi:tRNA (adenine22-N1)-methyltransferase